MARSLTRIDKAATNFFSLVSILAFVFIPLSLATSFFGMNIQELNSIGQPIWIFLVTSVAILLAALAIWAIFYQWTKFLHAPEVDPLHAEPGDEVHRAISPLTRVKSFLWLISHGHIVWCWRSGILFALLTNGRKGFTVTCDEQTCDCPAKVDVRVPPTRCLVDISTHSRHSPVAYIQAHSERQSRAAFNLSAAD